MTDDGVLSIRSNLLLRTAKDFRPDVLIVDHAPRGMRGELIPTLEWLSSQQPNCRRVIGLRDIIDAPEDVRRVWERDKVYDLLAASYEEIVIYGSRDHFDLPEEYGLPAPLRRRCQFVDFVVEEIEPGAKAATDGRPMIVVSAGGGDGAVELLIGNYLDVLERFPELAAYQSVLLPGPLASAELNESLRQRAESLGADYLEFVPSTSPYFRAAELCITTAGYNTSVQVLRYARRALMIPRILHRREQQIRAERLAAMGLCMALEPDRINAATLGAAIESALQDERRALEAARSSGQIRFGGAEAVARLCLGSPLPIESAGEVTSEI
jgi:predicted glycosyltransferase